jgi:hypothetical protein
MGDVQGDIAKDMRARGLNPYGDNRTAAERQESKPVRTGVMGFMDAHKCIGEVKTQPYDNRITVAASAIEGEGRIAVHGRTTAEQSIGGLMPLGEARVLVRHLRQAIDHAEEIAGQQREAMIPALRQRLADLEGRDASREVGPS